MTRGDPQPRRSRWARLRAAVQIEDVLLFGWLVLQPVLFPPHLSSAAPLAPDPVGGLLDLGALLLAAACLGARSRPGVDTGLMRADLVPFAVGPLLGAVVFAVNDVGDELGLADDLRVLPLVLAVVVAIGARLAVSPLGVEQRRVLVTPFILATSAFFGEFLGGFSDLFDLRFPIQAIGDGRPFEAALVLGLALIAAAIFYVMLVFAPRQIAALEGTAGTWTLRFLVFIAGISIGTTLAAMRG